MKHKVATLEGALLDAAVAKALGLDFDLMDVDSIGPIDASPVREGGWLPVSGVCVVNLEPFAPSLLDEHAGPIVERERIEVSPWPGPEWRAYVRPKYEYQDMVENAGEGEGQTPRIAAMRAYVASKFGEEVELP